MLSEEEAIQTEDGAFPRLTRSTSGGSGSSLMSNLDDEYDDILDGEVVLKTKEEQLTWSSKKPEFMSDWEIVVIDSTSVPRKSVRYFVHKLILSTGPTKSEQFASLFLGNGGENSIINKSISGNVSESAVPKSAAEAFSTLLNFLYSRKDKLDITTVNAVALRYLGRLYGIRKLVILATTFIRDDMVYSKSLHYLNAAAEFDDRKVMLTAAQTCAMNIKDVDHEGLVWLEPPPFFNGHLL